MTPDRWQRISGLLDALLALLRALRPEVPEPLAFVVDRCLEKDTRRRFADAKEVFVALRAI